MKHIVSATTLTSGAQLALCGYVFPSYETAVEQGSQGRELPLPATLPVRVPRGRRGL